MNELILKNKGNVNLYVNVVDELSPNKVKLFSRQHRFQMNTEVYHCIRKAQDEEILEFQVH